MDLFAKTIGARIYVKFRAFGITFGTVDKTLGFTVSFQLSTKQFRVSATQDDIPGRSGVQTLFNDRGVLLEVWA